MSMAVKTLSPPFEDKMNNIYSENPKVLHNEGILSICKISVTFKVSLHPMFVKYETKLTMV
jgi:hypothetical protein